MFPQNGINTSIPGQSDESSITKNESDFTPDVSGSEDSEGNTDDEQERPKSFTSGNLESFQQKNFKGSHSRVNRLEKTKKIKSDASKNKSETPEWVWDLWKDKVTPKIEKTPEKSTLRSEISPDDIQITLGKPFLYNDTLGWNWHKSWNIPSIFITIKPHKRPTDFKLKLTLKAVVFRAGSYDSRSIGEIQLSGAITQELINGQAIFSKITFSSTSFQNHGAKFHLVVSIFADDGQISLEPQNSLQTFISSPVFVDAKNRKKEAIKISVIEKISMRYFNPFPPKLLKSSFIRKKKLIGRSQSFNIENSLRGLYEYLSATHIRYKTKHPLFLVIKFSSCIKLFYNKLLVVPNQGAQAIEDSLIFLFQKYLDSGDPKVGSYQGSEVNPSMNFEKKHFMIFIEEPKDVDSFYLTKTIYQNFECIKHDYLHFTFSRSAIPNNFVEFPTAKLEKAYTACYPLLVKLKCRNAYDSLITLKTSDDQTQDKQEVSDPIHCKRDIEPAEAPMTMEPAKKLKVSSDHQPVLRPQPDIVHKTPIVVNRNQKDYPLPQSQQNQIKDQVKQSDTNLLQLEMALSILSGQNQNNFLAQPETLQPRTLPMNPLNNHKNLLMNPSFQSSISDQINFASNNNNLNTLLNNNINILLSNNLNSMPNNYINNLSNQLNNNNLSNPFNLINPWGLNTMPYFAGQNTLNTLNPLQNTTNTTYLAILKLLSQMNNNRP